MQPRSNVRGTWHTFRRAATCLGNGRKQAEFGVPRKRGLIFYVDIVVYTDSPHLRLYSYFRKDLSL